MAATISSPPLPTDVIELQRLVTLYRERVAEHERRERLYDETIECFVRSDTNTTILDSGEDVADVMNDIADFYPECDLDPIE